MAAVLRPPFYVPRPPDDQPWQGRQTDSALLAPLLTLPKVFGQGGQVPTKRWQPYYNYDVGESFWAWDTPQSALLAPLLTSIKIFGQGGQAPTKRWQPYYNYDAGESFWAWDTPQSAVLAPLLTSPKVFGQGGQVPTKRWQPYYNYDVGESAWQGETRLGRNFRLLALIAQTPFVNEPWKFSYSEDAFWQGQPAGSRLLAPLLTAAGQANPRLPWNFVQQWTLDWQSNSGGQRNLALLSPTVAPFSNGPWKLSYADDINWPGISKGSALLAPLLTAAGQCKPYRWPSGLDEGAIWQALFERNLRLLTTQIASPLVNPSWRFGYSDDAYWPGNPIGRNFQLLATSVVAAPFNYQPWKFGITDESVWQGTSSRSPTISLLTAVRFYGGGGQVPASSWRSTPDDTPAAQAAAVRNQSLLTAASPQRPFTNSGWRNHSDELGWQGRQSRSATIFLFIPPPIVSPIDIDRIVTIPAESRVVTVAAESRSVTTAAEDRTVTVADQSREV